MITDNCSFYVKVRRNSLCLRALDLNLSYECCAVISLPQRVTSRKCYGAPINPDEALFNFISLLSIYKS